MAFIKENLDDVQEGKPAPEGEYDLRIVKAEATESKKGRDMVKLVIAFDDGTDALPFAHYLMAWDDSDGEDQIKMRKLEIKRFCAAFDAPEDFDAEDLVGKTAQRVMVMQEVGQDDVTRNRMRLPRLKD